MTFLVLLYKFVVFKIKQAISLFKYQRATQRQTSAMDRAMHLKKIEHAAMIRAYMMKNRRI